VERYGQVIGRAKIPIDAGRHIHTHNLSFEELVLDYEFPVTEIPIPGARADAPTFLGYQREDGRVGTRNYIAVVAASNCAAHTADLIARSYEGAELPPNVDGCGFVPARRRLRACLRPRCGSVTGALSAVFWCTLMSRPRSSSAWAARSTRSITTWSKRPAHQPAGRHDAAGQRRHYGNTGSGAARNRPLFRQASAEARVLCPASKIVLGLNCGGSDSFSGITANPALGYCSDLLAEMGGTSVLAETPEIFGAEPSAD